MSIRAIRSGHPWITQDQYTNKFSPHTPFILATDSNHNELALLLNDPLHPQVKARLWTIKAPLTNEIEHFQQEFTSRLFNAIQRRLPLIQKNERENIYLAFGEADFLPGLFILLLGRHILIQSYCSFWSKKKNLILSSLQQNLKSLCPHLQIQSIQMQHRDKTTTVKFSTLFGQAKNNELLIQEFDATYSLKIGQKYDIGLYTDMSAIRKSIIPLIKKNSTVLNLFSYTGSFSILALKRKAAEVVSVDISAPNNKWLEHNIALNNLNSSNHILMEQNVENALETLTRENKLFDLIICDPPTFSQSEEKNLSSLSQYNKLIPNLEKLLSHGGKLIVFLNTHRVKRSKFKKVLTDLLKKIPNMTITQELFLNEDCFFLQSFPEGDYLKGFIIEKK